MIEANELLIKFRTHVMPLFPFVIIPDEDLPTLRQNSPFLLLYLITASLENNPPLQQRMETEVRKTIATRLILNMERNMDLLLGLLVHIAWCHYDWRTYHTQVYMFLQIAMMVVVDVGLDKYENFRMQRIAQDAHPSQKKNGLHSTPTGQRALLGCFYLCSKYVILHSNPTKMLTTINDRASLF